MTGGPHLSATAVKKEAERAGAGCWWAVAKRLAGPECGGMAAAQGWVATVPGREERKEEGGKRNFYDFQKKSNI